MNNISIDDIKLLIKNEPYIKDFINKNNISDEEIDDNIFVFEDTFKSIAFCKKCPGIENCPQKTKGEFLALDYNGSPSNVIKYCKYIMTEKQKEAILSKYVYTDISRNLLNLNLDNITCLNEWQIMLFKVFYDIANGDRKKGAYVYGGYGTGKTYFASALANTLVEKGYKVVFAKCNPFVTDMYTLMMKDPLGFEILLKKIKNADFVIFDDIGTENVTNFSRDRVLYNILEYRMDNNLCTIFTSNFDIDGLEVRFNQIEDPNSGRICERIKVLADEYVLKGDNHRHHD